MEKRQYTYQTTNRTAVPRNRRKSGMTVVESSGGIFVGGDPSDTKPSSLWLRDKQTEYLHLNEDSTVANLETGLASKGSVVAYATSDADITGPIANTEALGMIKVGEGLNIDPVTGVMNVNEEAMGGKGKIYYAGTGLQQGTKPGTDDTANEFSVKYGNAQGTALEGHKLYGATWWGQKLGASDIATGPMSGVTKINNLIHLDEASKVGIGTDKAGAWTQFAGGNSINGVTGTTATLDNLFLNYKDATHYTKVDKDNNVQTTGNVLAAADVKASGAVVAYATSEADITGPIAGANALGMIKVGEGLTIDPVTGVMKAPGTGAIGGVSTTGTGNVITSVSTSADKKTLIFDKALTAVNTADVASLNVASAAKLTTPRAINGTNFDGTAAITTASWGTARSIGIQSSDGTGVGTAVSANGSANFNLNLPATIKASLTGNASSATSLQTARNINGTGFNGASDITTSYWGTARTIYVSDAAGSYTGSGVSVNGSGNVTLRLPGTINAALSGNATTATTLQTTRSLWGQSFNGSGNVSGTIAGCNNIHNGGSAIYIGNSANSSYVYMNEDIRGNGLNWQIPLNGLASFKSVSVANTAADSIDTKGGVKAGGAVVAYATSSAPSPFKYWYPAVDTSGNLTWTDSASTTVPTARNIRGPQGAAGTTGAQGKQGQGTAYEWSGTSLRLGTIPLGGGSTSWGSYVNLKGATGATGATGAQGPKGATGAAGATFNGGTVYSSIAISGNMLGLDIKGGGNSGEWASSFLSLFSGSAAWQMRHSANGDLSISKSTLLSNSRVFYLSGSNAGNLWIKGSLTQNSDMRTKIITDDFNFDLNKIKDLGLFYYHDKDDDTGSMQVGFSAQAMRQILPVFVYGQGTGVDNDYYSVDYSKTGAILAIKTIQHVLPWMERVDNWMSDKDSRILELERKVELLLNEVERLKTI